MARKLTAAQKAAAAAKQLAADKKAAAQKKKDDAYYSNFLNPITSQYDPRIAENAIVKPENYGVFSINGPTWQQLADEEDAAAASGGGGGNGGGGGADTNITLISTERDEYGNVIGFYSDGSSKILVASGNKYKSTVDVDAYSILENTFKEFGLEELVSDIKKFMEAGLGSEQAGLELRKTTAYLTRFKGNEVRRAAGLNVLSEDAYLGLENSYNETLRRFGLQGYFGTDRKVATATMASIIGNDISAVEFRDRIDTVVTRVNNADPNVKATLRGFYNITDNDLVKYFLNPKENLPKLQEKVTAAEIGSEFIKQGLVTGVLSAEEFAKLGIDKQAAARGAETIAGILPETTKLGSIYDEEAINYTQKTAEEEVLKGLDSARRKRLRLAEKEIGSFSGSAGLARGALTNNRSSAF